MNSMDNELAERGQIFQFELTLHVECDRLWIMGQHAISSERFDEFIDAFVCFLNDQGKKTRQAYDALRSTCELGMNCNPSTDSCEGTLT